MDGSGCDVEADVDADVFRLSAFLPFPLSLMLGEGAGVVPVSCSFSSSASLSLAFPFSRTHCEDDPTPSPRRPSIVREGRKKKNKEQHRALIQRANPCKPYRITPRRAKLALWSVPQLEAPITNALVSSPPTDPKPCVTPGCVGLRAPLLTLE